MAKDAASRNKATRLGIFATPWVALLIGCSAPPADGEGSSTGGQPAGTAGAPVQAAGAASGGRPSGTAGSATTPTGGVPGAAGSAVVTAGSGGSSTEPNGTAGSSTEPVGGQSNGGSGGTGSAGEAPGAGGSAGASGGTPGSAGTGTTTPPGSFGSPKGTIANQPQDASLVGLPKGEWQKGLISPTLLKGTSLNQPTVVNGYLLIAGNEHFWFYDVSNPKQPKQLSAFQTPGGRGAEAESHSISYARYGDKFYLVTLSGTGIDTWDVTDPTAPKHQAQLKVAGTSYGDYTNAIWGLSWQGQYIYVGATNNGIKVVNAADPKALSIVGQISTSQYGGVSAGPVDAIGNVLVVTTPKESGGIATLDISDPVNPVRLASISAAKSYIGAFHRRYAFLIGPIRAWDVLSNPKSIPTSPLGTLNTEGSEYLSFGDDFLFLGHVRAEIGGTPGISKINAADPKAMKVATRVWGRQDLGGKNDDQFNVPLGNLVVIGDDQAPYAGWTLGVHQAAPDTKAPVIDTVIPKDKTTGVSTKTRIGVTFSDNIELATVNSASFIVRPVGGQPLAGKFGLRMSVVNFDPDEDLTPGTTYEVVLPAGGVGDYVGNRLTTEWKTTFTTN